MFSSSFIPFDGNVCFSIKAAVPKFRKSKKLNEIAKIKTSNISILLEIYRFKIDQLLFGQVYYVSEISEMIHIALEASLSFMPHILKHIKKIISKKLHFDVYNAFTKVPFRLSGKLKSEIRNKVLIFVSIVKLRHKT